MQVFHQFWTFGVVNYLLGAFPWTVLFLFFQYIGIRVYHLRNKDHCRRIQKRLKGRSTYLLDNNESAGFCVGFWYVANIKVTKSDYGDYFDIWLVTTEKNFNELVKPIKENLNILGTEEEASIPKTEIPITIYERAGTYSGSYFNKRTLNISEHEFCPRPKQQEIIEKIINHYHSKKFAVAFLHGEPGTGKSIIGLLMAKALRCSYCNTLQPWVPGDNISNIYNEIEPSENNPLVLVFDEIDIAMEKIHQGIPLHMNIPISVPDKTGWNRMMDNINWGLYPYVILLFISNKPAEFFDHLDPAYMRPGRINLSFQL